MKRISRACEHCRQHKRRCLVPHPCSACVSADIPCVVRTKARPLRRASKQPSYVMPGSPLLLNHDHDVDFDFLTGRSIDATVSTASTTLGTSRPTASESPVDPCGPSRPAEALSADAFDTLKARLHDLLLKRYGKLSSPLWSR